MMHLIEILLPLNNSGRPFRTETYAEVREHLTERFGGLTAFSRAGVLRLFGLGAVRGKAGMSWRRLQC